MAKKHNIKYEVPFTLYTKEEPVIFQSVTDWVNTTGNSGAIARDMLDGKVTYYKDWEFRG